MGQQTLLTKENLCNRPENKYCWLCWVMQSLFQLLNATVVKTAIDNMADGHSCG